MQSSTSPSPSSQARNAWCLGRSGRRKTASSSRHRSGSTWHLLYMNDPGSCSGQGRVDELAGEDGCERGQQRDTLLVQRREVATNARERRGAAGCAEAARDLLLDFEHAQVAFGLVIVERDGQVVEKGEHLFAAEPEPLQEIACRGLLDPATPARPSIRWRVSGQG